MRLQSIPKIKLAFYISVLFIVPLLSREAISSNNAKGHGTHQTVSSALTQEKTETKYLELIEKLPPRFEILLNIPATLLTLFDQGIPVASYKVAVGTRRWPTPSGKYHIDEIIWNPWWYPPPSDWAKDAEKTPPGPQNPLYPVKLMMEDALRIHGTPKTWTIGRAASHGCMRMYPQEVRALSEYLESELKADHNPSNFEEYRKKTWKTQHTKLDPDKEIWVYMVYQPLERIGNAVAIHPNFYRKPMAYQSKILDLLIEAGIYSAPLQWEKFNHEKKKVKRQSAVVPFYDFLPENSNLDHVDPSFHPICWEEKSKLLPTLLVEARKKYNTRLVLQERPAPLHHEPSHEPKPEHKPGPPQAQLGSGQGSLSSISGLSERGW